MGSLKAYTNEKESSYFMESKITTNFEAKTEQKINNLPNFGGLQRTEGNFFWPGTNFMCSVITKLKFWVYLEPPRISTSGENCRYAVGGHICPPLRVRARKIGVRKLKFYENFRVLSSYRPLDFRLWWDLFGSLTCYRWEDTLLSMYRCHSLHC